jgi:hypothetical protein
LKSDPLMVNFLPSDVPLHLGNLGLPDRKRAVSSLPLEIPELCTLRFDPFG